MSPTTFYIMWFILFITTVEVIQWSWTLFVHARWMANHRDLIKCKSLSFRMTYIAAFMAGCLSIVMFMWVIYVAYNGRATRLIVPMCIGTSLQLSHIHFMAILGRCVELPVSLWPPFSKWVSRRIIRRSPCVTIAGFLDRRARKRRICD